MSMPLREAAARYVLDLIRPEELPAVALDALVEGADTPHLRRLAGEGQNADPVDLRSLFVRAMTDLDHLPVETVSAARFLVSCVAKRVADGELAPREGARQIAEQILLAVYDEVENSPYVGYGLGLSALVGLHYDHDDVGPGSGVTHEEIDRTILEECRRLARTEPEDTQSRER